MVWSFVNTIPAIMPDPEPEDMPFIFMVAPVVRSFVVETGLRVLCDLQVLNVVGRANKGIGCQMIFLCSAAQGDS